MSGTSLMLRWSPVRDHRDISTVKGTGPDGGRERAADPPPETGVGGRQPAVPPAPPWHGHSGRRVYDWERSRDRWDRPGDQVPHNRYRERHRRQVGRRLRVPLHRSTQTRVMAGVCGGLAESTGIDVTFIRIAFVLLALGSGVGVMAYAIGWLFLPLQGENSTISSRVVADRQGLRIAASLLPAFVLFEIVVSHLHVWGVGSFAWPAFIALCAFVLIRRNASVDERTWINDDLLPMVRSESTGRNRRLLAGRILLGVLMGVAGMLVLVNGHLTGALLRPVGGALLVVAAIVVVFGPWWLNVVRDLVAERQARAIAEERTQMAAHVHDSVLQTLALIQRSSSDPTQVVRLARSQERELRAWLFEGRALGQIGDKVSTVSEGIEALQRAVETDHGVAVDTVVVGDCRLDDGLRAMLDASREAAVNAARWSGEPLVSLYAEVEPHQVMMFVRDRGRGFDPDAVGQSHHGIAESIRGRMARAGGSAAVRSAPGEGTEVALALPRRAA